MPGLSIDCVIFGFHDSELRVLLLQIKEWDRWALPGGFVRKDQDVDSEAVRVLHERTGLQDIFLRQFHFFGRHDRAAGDHIQLLADRGIIGPEDVTWLSQRFVSIGYYALVEYSKVIEPTPDGISKAISWCPIQDLPDLILDHNEILAKALDSLKQELNLRPIGINLLPKEFTLPELRSLYEAVLSKQLDRRNFRRKVLGFDILKDTGKRRTGGAHKAPSLYVFDEEKYAQAVEKGLKTSFV